MMADGIYRMGIAINTTLQAPHKGRGFVSAIRFLTTGTTIRIRAASSTNAIGSELNTDGTTRLTIVKM